MTYDELSNFTYDELSAFTYLELSLNKTQLLQSLMNNFRDDIPSSVILKLQKLCKDFLDNCDSNNLDIPPDIKVLESNKSLSIVDIFTIIGAIATVISTALGIYSAYNSKASNNVYLNQTVNYFIEQEYNTNINVIIEELEERSNTIIYNNGYPEDSDSKN